MPLTLHDANVIANDVTLLKILYLILIVLN